MPPSSTQASPSRFANTRWSLILAATGASTGTAAQRAMNQLAQLYWFPLYSYLRRKGHAPAAAEDLVQGLFAHLLEHHALLTVDPAKGKFRSFLLASLHHFMANQRDHDHAQKRGGTSTPLSLDTASAETRYAIEPADEMTPERLFEKRWAWAVLDRTLQDLRTTYAAKGQEKIFDTLKPALTQNPTDEIRTHMARQLALTPGALTVAIHRLRRRYRQSLRDQIAQTVASPELVDEEIQYLLRCL